MGALRVLILTAEREFASAAAALVRAFGHDVEIHHDEHDATGAAELVRPHVVLVDQTSPDTEGRELCQRLRQESKQPVRLVAITTDHSSEHLAKCRAAGFDFRFSKPLVADELERFLALSKSELT
jgi:DNA-binding response OmpR family regulator